MLKKLPFVLFLFSQAINAQTIIYPDSFYLLNASGKDPLYTTYAASMERSQLYGDKAYKMVYYEESQPVYYEGDQAGRFMISWMVNEISLDKTREFFSKPLVKYSFPDLAVTEYELFRNLKVVESFYVFSSSIAFIDVYIRNESAENYDIKSYSILERSRGIEPVSYIEPYNILYSQHRESHKRLISDLYDDEPYPEKARNFFRSSISPDTWGTYNKLYPDLYYIAKEDKYDEEYEDKLNEEIVPEAQMTILRNRFSLKPGESKHFRIYRGWQDTTESEEPLKTLLMSLDNFDLNVAILENEKLFSDAPRPEFKEEKEKIIYLSALNLARGCMLPPTGKTRHNFYVFSRNPLWGWGHGHQVLHESLSMLAYTYLDPESAMGSQRVYMEQQRADGLIAYRHGPRGLQDYPHKGMSTTSAPFYNWINYEVYQVSQDQAFLREAYESGKAYMNWLLKNRDTDQDGLFEWGPYGLIENVRDWYNVIFQVSEERHLDIDKEDISDELECLDLTLMISNELKYLAKMAGLLGKETDAEKWQELADKTDRLINETFWDDETGFFYHVDKQDHTFMFMDRDLKRQEIIGFLPMWSQSISDERADTLIKKLLDPEKFWRKYGIPTLSADDPFYSPYVDYCCKWNGPVWLLWDYMVYRGLKNYGYDDIASDLAQKMIRAAQVQLEKNHNFWESYSPDNEALDCPSNYIWDSILARLFIDEYSLKY
ncbi:MAG: amylo-alpha-1,6-glucosidase [Bacteroidales bacterium]